MPGVVPKGCGPKALYGPGAGAAPAKGAGTLDVSAAIAGTAGFIGSVISAAFAEPSINAFLMSAVPEDQRGRAVGTVGTAEAAAKAVGALIGGTLFGLGLWVPFVLSSLVGLSLILLGLPSLRAAGRDIAVLQVAALPNG